MIEIRGLDFSFAQGGFRLKVDALDVAPGEHVAIVGPSGSGKTTLLNLVAGIWQAEQGAITIDGHRIDRLSDAERRSFRLNRLGLVFQTFELIEYLDVQDNILLPFRIGADAVLDKDVRDRARALAEAAGIGAKMRRYPHALSQGERQRAAICRALITMPGLILADEATGNLDPKTKRLVLDLLFERAREVGAAILAVTHDHELLPSFDRSIDFAEFLA